MADQPRGLAVFFDLRRGEVGELLHQMRPVAGDGVLRVVAELLQSAHRKTACAQAAKQDRVGAGREAVAVRKNDHDEASFLRA
jgi:hypothetical protein